MKSLFKVALTLGLVFASTFLIAKILGLLSVEQVRSWLEALQELSHFWVAVLVVALLFADLFIAVPTLTVTLLAGYFLGFEYGSLAAITGMCLAGGCGYLISHVLGPRILSLILKDEFQKKELMSTFHKSGFVMILLSRAVPILPEVTACLAGMTRMRPAVFILAWILATVPYALIAAYAGSVSTIDNPKPALMTAVGLSGGLWLCWWLFSRRT